MCCDSCCFDVVVSHLLVVVVVVFAGAHTKARDCYGSTPLHFAVHSESLACVEMIVNGGADVNAANKDGLTVSGVCVAVVALLITMLLLLLFVAIAAAAVVVVVAVVVRDDDNVEFACSSHIRALTHIHSLTRIHSLTFFSA